MLLELLETFASVDDNSGQKLSRKRSSSSIYGQDLANGGAAEAANPNGGRKSILQSVSSTLKSYETVCQYE